MQQLASDGTNGYARHHAVDVDCARPRARRQDDGAARQRSAVGVDEHLGAAAPNAPDAALLDQLCAVAARRRDERVRQLCRGDEPVILDQQTARDAVREQRLLGSRRCGVEEK